MICQTKAGKFSALIFTSTCLICVSAVLSIPVSSFQSTSYTADNNGSHAVILSGDDTTGTHIKVASGPPMNSDSITSRFASPTNQSTYFIPAGQDQTIHVRTGNTNTDISARTGTSSGGGVISSRFAPSGGTYAGSSAYAGNYGASAGAQAGTQSKPHNDYYDDSYDN